MPASAVLAMLGAALVLVLSPVPARAQQPTPEIFGAPPTVGEAEISPDGKTLALLQDANDSAFIVFRDLDAPEEKPRGARIDDAVPRALYWANDDTLLAMVSQASRQRTISGLAVLDTYRWLAISRTSLKSRVLFDNELDFFVLPAGTLLATLPEEPNRLVFSRWTSRGSASFESAIGARLQKETRAGVALFSVRLDTGARTVTAIGTPDTHYWLVDASGQAVMRVDEVPIGSGADTQTRIYARDQRTGRLRRVKTADGPDAPALIPTGISLTSGKMLATTRVGNTASVVEFDLESGTAGEPVFHHPDHDYSAVIYDSRVAAVRGVRFTDDLPRMVHFDPAEQQLQDELATLIPGSSPIIWSRSADARRYVVRATYTDRPALWFVYDKPSSRLTTVGSTYQPLDGKVLASKRRYDYIAADGQPIRGYLTVPSGAQESNLPLVVLPHGGPWDRDDQAFDYWPFFYASRGYLVYQPNFRGSNGYGARFRLAGDGQWGRKMQDDITQGVHKLIADGLVDAKRICIVGASYGGYAALVGATMGDGLYACAVGVNSVTSVGDLIGDRDRSHREFWEARIGKRGDIEALHEISPARQAHRARTPILLIHGKHDTVVNIGQSRAMAKALAAHDKPHQLIELDGGDHWLSRGKTRIEMLARSIEFIDKHIGAAGDRK